MRSGATSAAASPPLTATTVGAGGSWMGARRAAGSRAAGSWTAVGLPVGEQSGKLFAQAHPALPLPGGPALPPPGIFNKIHHDIGTHVVHHLFPQVRPVHTTATCSQSTCPAAAHPAQLGSGSDCKAACSSVAGFLTAASRCAAPLLADPALPPGEGDRGGEAGDGRGEAAGIPRQQAASVCRHRRRLQMCRCRCCCEGDAAEQPSRARRQQNSRAAAPPLRLACCSTTASRSPAPAGSPPTSSNPWSAPSGKHAVGDV